MAQGSIGGTKMSDLPASSYAYCEPGSGAPGDRCHFPIRDSGGKPDAAHVRNALARLSQSPFGPKARGKVVAAAHELGIDVSGDTKGKSFTDMKAELMTEHQLDRWLAGEISRRVMVLPFSGPLPGGKAGLDIDGEYFDETTDTVGPFPFLRTHNRRVVDWHHDGAGVPAHAQWMKGAILGEIVLDAQPSELTYEDEVYEGIAADWWANAGDRRMKLVQELARRNKPIFGSTQTVPWSIQKASDGHLEVWPIIRHTMSTSPQNTHAVVPSLKASLLDPDSDAVDFSHISVVALKAAMLGLDALAESARGEAPAADDGAAVSDEELSAEDEEALTGALGVLVQALPLIHLP